MEPNTIEPISNVFEHFDNGCLRKICRLFSPNKICNVELHKKTGCNNAVPDMKLRRLRRQGQVLRMRKDSIPKIALRWPPPGRRARTTKDKMTGKTVMAELQEMGLSWNDAQTATKDRTLWRSTVVALCPAGDEEDK